MKRWRKQIRLAVVAVAGFVLLVTVLPQVASGIGLGSLANRLDGTTTCSSGSSGSGSVGSVGSSDSSSSCCSGSSGSSGGSDSASSGCVAGTGTVTGTATITGAPAGFSPAVVGAGVCPEPDPGAALCANPQFSLDQNGTYSLSLAPGSYVLWAFYETTYGNGAFLGTQQTVTVESGGTQVLNVTVPYAKPAAVNATLTVTGLPAGVQIQSATVTLCPVGITYSPTTGTPLPCATGYEYLPTPTSGPVLVALLGLPAGQWTAYPGYCTQFGCSTGAASPKPVVTTAGKTTKVKLSTPYQVPPVGILSATVNVSGAPAGFAPPTGIEACQVVGFGTTCEGVSNYGPGPLTMQLNDGLWELAGFYTVAPFDNAITGPIELVNIQGGQVTSLVFDVPYQVLGAVTGTIKVAGLPGGVHPTGYALTACPNGNPVTDLFLGLSCVFESSGTVGYTYGAAHLKQFGRTARRAPLKRAGGAKLNSFDLPNLPPGTWTLYPSYTTKYGSFGSNSATTVVVTAGGSTRVKVVTPYQAPQLGLVTGTLKLVNSPNGFAQGQIRACSAAPTATSCNNEVDATPGPNGAYQLQLPAGSWWVQGESWLYGGQTTQLVTSAATQLSVSAGVHYKANFVVPLI